MNTEKIWENLAESIRIEKEEYGEYELEELDESGYFETQGEPSDAQVRAAAREYHERGNGEGSFDRMADHVRTSLLFRMGCALRAAGGVR